jgi:hypothetical protein
MSTAWDLAPSTLAQWAGAVATFGAVLVALFKDPIRGLWNKPKLKVTCTTEDPETVRVQTTTWQGRWFGAPGGGGGRWDGYSYFVRIKVENKGRTRAEKVQVGAMKLARQSADRKSFATVPTTLPFNMRWSNSPPTAATVLDGISRNMWAFCDIVSFFHPGNPYQRRPADANPAETVGKLELEFDLPSEWHLLAPGTYQLTLRIGGANVAPIDRIVEFAHDGKWTDDDEAMRRNHLAVSLK